VEGEAAPSEAPSSSPSVSAAPVQRRVHLPAKHRLHLTVRPRAPLPATVQGHYPRLYRARRQAVDAVGRLAPGRVPAPAPAVARVHLLVLALVPDPV
jgi:hypothetical protein